MNEILAPIVGAENITATDGNLLVTPETAAQMSQVVQLCQQNAWKIRIQGGGSKLDWGNPGAKVDLTLSTAKLDRLIDHAVGDLTVTIEAGYRFQALQAKLAQAQQCLGIDPPYPERATLGGIVATGDSGSWRHRYNSVRDQILGIKFIRSDGEIIHAGGRVVKNVAGYDLMKLFTGSYGSLGIITEVTFRLYPLPQPRQFWLCQGEPSQIVELRTIVLRSSLTPLIVDLYSPCLLQNLGYKPAWGMGVEFAGISAEFQGDLLDKMAQNLGISCQLVPENFPRSVSKTFETKGRCKIGVPSAQALTLFTPLADSHPLQIHLGSGLGLLLINSPDQVTEWRQKLIDVGGFLTILTGEWGTDRCYVNPSVKELMIKIKHQFDPQGIFNPIEGWGEAG